MEVELKWKVHKINVCTFQELLDKLEQSYVKLVSSKRAAYTAFYKESKML